MKCSNWKPGTLAAVAAAAATFMSQAHAAPLISLSVVPANVAVGGSVGVDINVSGLTEAVGAFYFDFSFDGTRLSFDSFLADPDTKMGDGLNPALDFSGGNIGFSVNFDVLAGFVDAADEATLAGLQGTGFRLGRVDLTALNNIGFADLTLSGFSLSDYDGFTIADVGARNGQVCVSTDGQTPCVTAVPEPMTPLLVAAALGALAFSRRPKRV